MSQQNRIEGKLLEMEAGRFQLLCNDLLTRLNYGNITNSGGQIGTDKTIKGTPDAYILCENDKFIFIEYSVAQSNLKDKFIKDIRKCFNVKKTGVEIEKIDKLVLMYNSVLSVGEVNELMCLCDENNVKLEKYDMTNISSLLNEKFPYLAEEYFSIEMSTGQFLDKSGFVKANKKTMLSTPLDIEIRGRIDEIEQATNYIEKNNYVLIVGKSGVGKTRLAIEAIERYSKEFREYKAWYVRDIGAGIYRDIVKYTQYDKHIVFIDDINKLTSIDSVLDYISEHQNRIKLVATVRDYALSSTLTKSTNFMIPELIKLTPLENQVIEEICKSEFKIYNPAYLNRITKLSKGNPRIAVMMAIVATKENSLESIQHISDLLEVYYSDISRKLLTFEDNELLKVLGIIAFHDKLHLEDEMSLLEISSLLHMSIEDIRKYINILFRMELVDIYEDEVARISDQILSVFVFHYVFVKRKIIEYEDLFKLYFHKYTNRLIQNINSITTYYGNLDFFIKSIDSVWEEWKSNKSEYFELLVLKCWFVREMETLVYLKTYIDNLSDDNVCFEEYLIERNEQVSVPEEIETLCYFSNSELHQFAFELLLTYLIKQHGKIKSVSMLITQNFGYTKHSFYNGYNIQYAVIMKVIELLKTEDQIYYQLFVNMVLHLLSYDFEYTESSDGNSMTFSQIGIANSGKMVEIRESIWTCISNLLDSSTTKKFAFDILKNLKFGRFIGEESELYDFDFDQLNKKILIKINPKDFYELFIMDNLENNVFKFNDKSFNLEDISKSKEFDYYRLLSSRFLDLDRDYSKGRQIKRTMLCDFISEFDYNDYVDFFESVGLIEKYALDKHEIKESLHTLTECISDEHLDLFVRAYIYSNTPYYLNPISLIERCINVHGKQYMLSVLHDYCDKESEYWYFCYFSVLKAPNVTKKDYNMLMSHIAAYDAMVKKYYRNISFLVNYCQFDESVFVNFSKLIIDKNDDELINIFFYFLFGHNDDDLKTTISNYSNNYTILVEIYLKLLNCGNSFDYDSRIFRELHALDNDLIFKVCDIVFEKIGNLTRRDIWFDFSAFWEMPYSLIEKVFDYTISNHCEYFYEGNFEKLFAVRNDKMNFSDYQDECLKQYILKHNEDIDIMKLVYSAIAGFSVNRRVDLLVYFVQVNKSFDLFSKLPMRKRVEGWSGSEVPYVERKISFYEQLNNQITSIELLQHKDYIKGKIRYLENSIKRIRINEFLRDY